MLLSIDMISSISYDTINEFVLIHGLYAPMSILCQLTSVTTLWGGHENLPFTDRTENVIVFSHPGRPFSLNFSPGPGIAPTVKTGEEVGFVVDAKTAGKGKVTCTVLTPDGTEAEADVIENEDGTYDIFYTAAKPGTYVIYVRFGGVDIPNSPFTVMVRRSSSQEHTLSSRNSTAAIC